MNHSDYIINQDFGVDNKALREFYSKAFGEDRPEMPNALLWLHKVGNGSSFGPFAVWHKDKIIGTWSSIPEQLILKGNPIEGAWTLNLFVLPEHRGKGLAEALLDKQKEFNISLMGISANKASLSIYLKKGFRQTNVLGSTTFIYLLPFAEDKFGFLRKFGVSGIFNRMYRVYLKLGSNGERDFIFKLLSESNEIQKNLNLAFTAERDIDARVRVLRDDIYFNHRVLNSPNFKRYYGYQCNGFYALVHHKLATQSMDVLWVSNTSKTLEYIELIKNLVAEATRMGLRGVRFFTSNHEVSASLKTRFVVSTKTPLSIIYHPDPAYLEMLLSQAWDVQNIDTDLEGFIL